jgi:hypothetical protein
MNRAAVAVTAILAAVIALAACGGSAGHPAPAARSAAPHASPTATTPPAAISTASCAGWSKHLFFQTATTAGGLAAHPALLKRSSIRQGLLRGAAHVETTALPDHAALAEALRNLANSKNTTARPLGVSLAATRLSAVAAKIKRKCHT